MSELDPRFVVLGSGPSFLGMDLSQIELKMFSHLSSDYPKTRMLPEFDIVVDRIGMAPGRNKMTKSSRIRKKWLKRYGSTEVYEGCSIKSYYGEVL